jgi:hypothetical protein
MKPLKLTILIALFALTTTLCKAQDYATVNYWGKDYKLDRSFFEALNSNYTYYMSNTAPNWKYYDFKDYQDIYITFVDNLKSSKFTIIVTEANQLRWQDPIGVLPGTDGEKGRGKKSFNRASLLLYNVVLPSLQQFVKSKS